MKISKTRTIGDLIQKWNGKSYFKSCMFFLSRHLAQCFDISSEFSAAPFLCPHSFMESSSHAIFLTERADKLVLRECMLRRCHASPKPKKLPNYLFPLVSLKATSQWHTQTLPAQVLGILTCSQAHMFHLTAWTWDCQFKNPRNELVLCKKKKS